ncbi:E domain-containing protein [Staphylococcus epidermidis]|uniref:E domain-containing protein n=1 Tax=Staphylococcus epidermidis TaxID=1282 RepID=UPI001933542E|nr:E domain-containing protein [Staphylococcus epidermidis]MBM0777399.1 YSIRK-type signal peptide-containing protein [Staphylococcus epidermidis]
MKKRLDFMPNKQNKYSIRRFTVGTASILVGATLFLGIGNEAKADELVNQSSENKVETNQNAEDASELTKAPEQVTPETQASKSTTAPEKKTVDENQSEQSIENSKEINNAKEEAEEANKSTEQVTPETQASKSTTAPEEKAVDENQSEQETSEVQAPKSLLATSKEDTSSESPQRSALSKDSTSTYGTKPRSVSNSTNDDTKKEASTSQSQAKQVGNWDEYIAAMNDKSVSNIQLTDDISANKNGELNANTGRAVSINGDGHTLDTSKYYVNAPANSGNWDITLKNADLKTNNNKGFINFEPNTSGENTLTLKDVNHKGSNIVDNKANSNLTVNLKGKVNSESNDNSKDRATIGAKNINIDSRSTVDFTRNGLGNALQVFNDGAITSGKNATINIDVSPSDPWKVSNGNTAFKLGNNSKVQLGDNSKTDVKGQNIFDFGNGGTLNTGIGSTVKVDQKGNGNIVNMGTDSTFEVAENSKFIANSDGHRIGDWKNDNLIGLDGNSQILVDKEAKLLLDAKNHQWDPDKKKQVGAYNDLVNINARGNQTALLHVADNATLDLRTDNRDYYAEVISIPLSGSNENRRYVFDDAYYVNLQKTSKVTSGESKNGEKPNLIFMDPKSPGYFQWNGSYTVKSWDPKHYSSSDQHADADDVWDNVVDLKAQQDGFETGVPTYNKEKSTLESTSGKSLNELNLNHAQRLVLISNNSDNPEVHPETKTEDIPFDTKRKFDPDLKPGEERVVQKGEKGTKTITTPTTINPITGEKVGEGKPTEKITKDPVDEITEFGGEEIKPGHKDVFDPNAPVDSKEDIPGKPGIKNPETGETVKEPKDSITKYGPKAGEPETKTEDIPFDKKRKFNPDLKPGEERVVQKGEKGTKTITTPTTINPITGEKVGEGKPTEKITKDPVDEITEFGGEEIKPGHKDVFDPNAPVDSKEDIPGKPGIKNPETGETVKEPKDSITKYGPKAGEPETKTEDIPFDKKRKFNPDLKPGEERVVQKGEKGTKTITTPTTINPITGEKVGEGKPTEKITKEPIDQVVEYGPNKEYPSNPNKPGKPEQPTNNENNKSGDHQSSHSSNKGQSQEENGMDFEFNHDKKENSIQTNEHLDKHKDLSNKAHSSSDKKQLPDTGSNDTNNGTLIGSLLALIGSLFVFSRRKNKQNNEK